MERDTTALRPHPQNKEIYGADGELIESVKEKGILTPLLITKDNIIVSGHRRWRTAKAYKLPTVPVMYFGSEDEWDILEALIFSNRGTRQRTNEQLGREALALQTVEQARAKERQRAAQNNNNGRAVRATMPQQENGKARDAVAKKIGTGSKKATALAYCTKLLDVLTRDGNTEKAKMLRAMLNRNVFKAYRLAQQLDPHRTATAQASETTTPKTRYITGETWRDFSAATKRDAVNAANARGKDGVNTQKTGDIDWAKWSWNPVVGCLHNCPYCYARDIAEQLYPQKFEPALVPDRLHAPKNVPVPPIAQHDISYKNIFVCSMADLFGKWVPREWIQAVLDTAAACPQWNFLFLSKFPIRMQEFTYSANCWLGTSVDCQARVENAEKAFREIPAKVKWLSCEPLLEPLRFTSLDMFQWVVMGGASASTQTPEFRPPFDWIVDLHNQARAAGCQIYQKSNLGISESTRLKEFPGAISHDTTQAVLKQFHYPLLAKPKAS